MKDSHRLVSQSVREIEALNKTSATEAGPSDSPAGNTGKDNVALQDVINQVFALFRINYHNQYHAAFSDTQLLNQAKRLWLESLCHFTPEQILRGAREVIEHSDYLPTLHRMIDCCENTTTDNGVPSVRDAYLEACLAPSPKAAHPWSHPVVYYSGLETGWHLLHNEPESLSFPKFAEHYRRILRQAAAGKTFPTPSKVLEEQPGEPLSRQDNLQHLKQLRDTLDL